MVMSVQALTSLSDQPTDDGHDHTWIRVRGDFAYVSMLEYLCVHCGLGWSSSRESHASR
jgi:hypothetical protein